MKLSTTKHGLKALLSGFFLVGFLLLSGTRAGAQDLNNWLQSDEAKSTLEVEIKSIHADLPNLAGAQLNEAKAHVYYYKEIYLMLNDGKPVATSVPNALDLLYGNSATPKDVTVNPTLKNQLYTDAVLLLSQ